MTPAAIVQWSETLDRAGKLDAMGGRWTDWQLAVRMPNGTALRDDFGHQVFETQADYKARQRSAPIGQTLDLFA